MQAAQSLTRPHLYIFQPNKKINKNSRLRFAVRRLTKLRARAGAPSILCIRFSTPATAHNESTKKDLLQQTNGYTAPHKCRYSSVGRATDL
jgi:hypothetical protein